MEPTKVKKVPSGIRRQDGTHERWTEHKKRRPSKEEYRLEMQNRKKVCRMYSKVSTKTVTKEVQVFDRELNRMRWVTVTKEVRYVKKKDRVHFCDVPEWDRTPYWCMPQTDPRRPRQMSRDPLDPFTGNKVPFPVSDLPDSETSSIVCSSPRRSWTDKRGRIARAKS